MKNKIIIILLFFILVSICILFSYKNSYLSIFYEYNGFVVEGSMIVKYKNKGGNVIIPKVINGVTITNIGSYAFNDLDIDSIIIPDSIVSIGDYAFAGNNISYLNIPSSVSYLGEGAFIHNKIRSLKISPNTIVGNACFNDNSLDESNAFFLNSIGEVISYGGFVKGNVVVDYEVIGEKAFYESGIVSVTLTDSVKEVKDLAFAGNYLVDVYMPKSVNNVSTSAFVDNNYLIDIYIDN